jgi:hypothetical protein
MQNGNPDTLVIWINCDFDVHCNYNKRVIYHFQLGSSSSGVNRNCYQYNVTLDKWINITTSSTYTHPNNPGVIYQNKLYIFDNPNSEVYDFATKTWSRCQFQQHFTQAFFIWKCFVLLFSNCTLTLWNFVERVSAQKLLIKCWWNWLQRSFYTNNNWRWILHCSTER